MNTKPYCLWITPVRITSPRMMIAADKLLSARTCVPRTHLLGDPRDGATLNLAVPLIFGKYRSSAGATVHG